MNVIKRCLILLMLLMLPLGTLILLIRFPDQVSGQVIALPQPAMASSLVKSVKNNSLELIGQIGGGGYNHALAISLPYAYLGENNGFRILDVNDPSHLALKARMILTDVVVNIDISGTIAYVANYGNGLQMIDIGTPANPSRVGNYQAPGHTVDVQVVGNLAHVAYSQNENSGLVILDVTNPEAPVVLSDYPIPGGVYSIDVIDNIAYVAAADAGLIILDINNPLSPTLLSNYDTPGSAEDVDVEEGIAYVVDGGYGLQIVDVTTPVSPMWLGSLTEHYYMTDVQIVDGLAYIADPWISGLLIVDVSIPTAPAIRGEYAAIQARQIYIADDQAYVIEPDSLYVVNISSPDNPTLTSHYYPDFYTEVEPVADVVYAAAGHAGLQILNLSQPVTPTVSSVYDYITDNVVAADNSVYANNSKAGFHILNTYQPFTPTLLGSYSSAGEVKQVTDGLAYTIYDALCGSAVFCELLNIIDVSDPASPVLLSSFDLNRYYFYSADIPIGDVRIKNGFAYMTLTSGQHSMLKIVDVRNPLAPAVISDFALSGRPTGSVQLWGNLAYVALRSGGIQLIDVRRPQLPVPFATYPVIEVDKLLIMDEIILSTTSDHVEMRNRYTMELLTDYPLVVSGDLKAEGDLVYVTNSGELNILRMRIDVDVTRLYLPFVIQSSSSERITQEIP